MTDEGYTYSYRKKWHNPVFRNLLEAAVWSWMCDSAAWKDTKVRFNGDLVEIKRGQLITSIRFISSGFGIGEQVTRTFLENLENDGMLNTVTTHRGTIITICNYDKYQSLEKTNNTLTNEQPTHSQHTANTNKKKDKEIKETKEEVIEPLPEWLSCDVWSAFKKMRTKSKKSMTEEAERLAIAKLDRWRLCGHDPTEILNYSILNGYPGLYEPKGNNNANSSRNPTSDKSKWASAAEQYIAKHAQPAG